MKLFDMHCDTLYRAYTESKTLFEDDFHISFRKAAGIPTYIQCLAVWIPDEYRKKEAWELFEGCVSLLEGQLAGSGITWCRNADDIRRVASEGGHGIILTVESGSVLGGDPGKVQTIYDMGVRMMTLTWNGRNELGDGIMEDSDIGLTQTGREVIREMERVGMIVDISHAGERLFSDVAEIAERPFVASHSNIRAMTSHRRNLTDGQFVTLMERGGLTGLNFCADFLRSEDNDGGFDLHHTGMCDIIRHAGYMLSAGGINNIAMGADFDGADIPQDITGIESMEAIYEAFCRKFGQKTADAVFFDNAYRFFTQNLR